MQLSNDFILCFRFLLGFVFPLLWYYATILYFGNYYRRDPRERAGLAASAIAVITLSLSTNNLIMLFLVLKSQASNCFWIELLKFIVFLPFLCSVRCNLSVLKQGFLFFGHCRHWLLLQCCSSLQLFFSFSPGGSCLKMLLNTYASIKQLKWNCEDMQITQQKRKGKKKNSPKTVPQEKLRLDDKIQIQLVSKCFELYVQIEENLFTCKLDTRFHKYIFDSSFEARKWLKNDSYNGESHYNDSYTRTSRDITHGQPYNHPHALKIKQSNDPEQWGWLTDREMALSNMDAHWDHVPARCRSHVC